jgi:hypothetical protein
MISNASAVNNYINSKVNRITNSMVRGLNNGMREFEAYEIKREMSGRPGLKRQTRNLSQSWRVNLEGKGLDTVAYLRNRPDAWYAIVHEKGGTFVIPMHSRAITKGFTSSEWTGKKIKKRKFRLQTGQTQVRAHTMYMPKRLNMYENFDSFGKNMIIRNIKEELSKTK